jgi:predicted secreted protein
MNALREFRASILVAVVACLMSGCATPPHSAYEYQDPAMPITVPAGQVFSIRLMTDRTAGYDWKLAHALDSSRLALVQTQYTKPATEFSTSTGYMVWTFRALAPGQTMLSMAYTRSWEAAPAETATFNVMIR